MERVIVEWLWVLGEPKGFHLLGDFFLVSDELPFQGHDGTIECLFKSFAAFLDENDPVRDVELNFGDFVFDLTAVFQFEDDACINDFVEKMFEFAKFLVNRVQ